ncbi:MAG: hypothetical protein WA230_14845 [Xanthobacteraceae bacterium]
MLRMTRASKGFGRHELLFAEVDHRLIPEFDPTVIERLVETDPARGGRRVPQFELLQQVQDGLRLDRFFEHRQHLQMLLLADTFDMCKHSRAAAANKLHLAPIVAVGELEEALDSFAEFQSDIEEDNMGRTFGQRGGYCFASGKFLRIETGAMQNERQEAPDAVVGVDDEAEGDSRSTARRRRIVGRFVGGGEGSCRGVAEHLGTYILPFTRQPILAVRADRSRCYWDRWKTHRQPDEPTLRL